MTSQTATPDSIIVSGITSETGLNGEYVLNGTFRGDKPQWMKPMSRCYIRFIRDRWELYVSHHPSGTTYCHHPDTTADLPPTSGYTQTLCVGADAVLSLEYKYKAAPTSEYVLYTNKACPFAQQVGIVLKELEKEFPQNTSRLEMVEHKLIDIFSKNDVDFTNSYYQAYPSKVQRPAIPLLAGAVPGNKHITIAETQLIIEYLMDEMEMRNGETSKLRAKSSFQKSKVGILIHAVQKEVFPCINYILNASNLERLETAVEKLMDALKCIEMMLKRIGSMDKFCLGSEFSLAEAKTVPTFQRLLLVVPELRSELALVKSLKYCDDQNGDGGVDTILLRMIEIMFPTLFKWLSSAFQHPSVVETFHKEEVTQVLKRARVNKFEMPAQFEEESFQNTKSKMEGLLLSRKKMPSP